MPLPDGALALGAGTVLALGAATVVLGPLLRDDVIVPPPAPPRPRTTAPEASAVEALREIEFDRATGKLSDDDYRELKTTYTRQALAELRAKDAAATTVVDDEVERLVNTFRTGTKTCPVDGVRPESDALFCSQCGRYLPGACPHCGATADGEAQRFCGNCGNALAA